MSIKHVSHSHPFGFHLLAVLLLAASGSAVHAQEVCGNPFEAGWVDDYRNRTHDKSNRQQIGTVDNHLKRVEGAHYFKFLNHPNLEVFMSNMDFVLRHFPNHYPALQAVASRERRELGELQLKGQFRYDPGLGKGGFPMTAECYFQRAIRFRPDDFNVYLLYGIHLHLTRELDKALEQYKTAEKIAPDSAELHNNLGLLYFEREQYDLAKAHAKKAYRLGYPLPGLRDKLTEIGLWRQ